IHRAIPARHVVADAAHHGTRSNVLRRPRCTERPRIAHMAPGLWRHGVMTHMGNEYESRITNHESPEPHARRRSFLLAFEDFAHVPVALAHYFGGVIEKM
ncbi:hypothetical protein, partial [Pantoea ananatis]|uniref:hypothetical protein n=1 Tax=Pantoea ananas TaxID=553 RepID=UPI0039B840D3